MTSGHIWKVGTGVLLGSCLAALAEADWTLERRLFTSAETTLAHEADSVSEFQLGTGAVLRNASSYRSLTLDYLANLSHRPQFDDTDLSVVGLSRFSYDRPDQPAHLVLVHTSSTLSEADTASALVDTRDVKQSVIVNPGLRWSPSGRTRLTAGYAFNSTFESTDTPLSEVGSATAAIEHQLTARLGSRLGVEQTDVERYDLASSSRIRSVNLSLQARFSRLDLVPVLGFSQADTGGRQVDSEVGRLDVTYAGRSLNIDLQAARSLSNVERETVADLDDSLVGARVEEVRLRDSLDLALQSPLGCEHCEYGLEVSLAESEAAESGARSQTFGLQVGAERQFTAATRGNASLERDWIDDAGGERHTDRLALRSVSDLSAGLTLTTAMAVSEDSRVERPRLTVSASLDWRF